MTTVQPIGRFGSVEMDNDDVVSRFQEKPKGDGAWINAGFFVFEPTIFNYIENDSISLEKAPLETIATNGELVAFRHKGFWKPMDTLREKYEFEKLWRTGTAPWKVWDE